MKPEISIVVPVYNRKDRLISVLKSLLAQTYTGSYELIVVDDGSNDGACDNIQALDDRIVVIRQKNRGAAVARHRGVKKAKGNVIVFHDSDDIATNYKLEVLYNALKKNLNCCGAFAITKPLKKNWTGPDWLNHTSQEGYYVFKDPLSHYFSHAYPLATAMNIAYYKKVAYKATEDSVFYKAGNDYHLQFKAAIYGPVVGVAKITTYYYMNDGNSISKTFGPCKQALYTIFSLIEVFETYRTVTHKYQKELMIRVENEAPAALLYLIQTREFGHLFWKLFRIMLKYTRLYKLPKRFYWAWCRLR